MSPGWWRVLAALLFWAGRGTCGPRYSSRIVDTASGSVRGIIVEPASRHLEPVEVFRGVPYAAPPVGSLRFRSPQPPSRRQDTRLADAFGPVCPQNYPDVSNRTAALHYMPKGRLSFLKKFVPFLVNQSEDCLFLNIYVPGNGAKASDAPYPVIFFIHGESFEWGSGNPYDGSVIASYGHVIFITVNFRLGVLGFLRIRTNPSVSGGGLGDSNSSSFAVRDLLAALRWIRANIGAFGGDAGRVTLLGHGTGAALANLLLVSPAAKGLFQRVILLSGSALSPWASIHDPDSLYQAVGEQTGCLSQETITETYEDISNCLRSAPLSTLLSTRVPRPRFMSAWAPTISQDVVLSMERSSEAFNYCEMLLSATSSESYADFNAGDIQYGFEEEQRNRVLRTYIRNAYVYHLNEIFSAVRNEYTDWDKPIQHPINIRDSTMEALSDGHTLAPMLRVAYLHSKRGAATYFAHFAYQTKESDYPQRVGSVRGEDLTYITGLPLVNGHPYFPHNYSRQDITVAESILNLFTNFAKSGDPNEPRGYVPTSPAASNTAGMRHRSLSWERYEPATQLYLSITSKPKMKSHYRGHKMALWLNLIPQLHQPGDDDVSMRHHHFHEREQHYYAGSVRAESFTRLPPSLHPASMANPQYGAKSECVTDQTTDDELLLMEDEDDIELLHRLASKHYYSYAAALAITIGVGCLLLLLNMIIFAGIYYQKGRDRRQRKRSSRSSSSPSSEDIPMSVRSHSSPCSSSKHHSPSGEKHIIKIYEPPPCYNTLPKSANVSRTPVSSREGCKNKRGKPLPPVRSSSNPPDVTIKKRVQVQEISV